MKAVVAVFLAIACSALGDVRPVVAKDITLPPEECARKALVAEAKSRALTAAISAEANYAEAHGGAFSPKLTQEFVQWYDVQRSKPGNALPELWRTNLSSDESGRRQAAIDRFTREKTDSYRARLAEIGKEAERGCPAWENPRSVN